MDWTQFDIIVEEPAGRYGIAGGQVIQDAFGNPLGTTYNPDGSVATLGDGTLNPVRSRPFGRKRKEVGVTNQEEAAPISVI